MCEKKYLTKDELTDHWKDAHDYVENFKCLICDDQQFATIKSHDNHMKEHHPEEQPFKCHFCDKAYNQMRRMKVHSYKFHTHVKKVLCALCGVVRPSQSEMNTHMKQVHGKKTVVCDLCGKTSTCQRRLQEHIQRMHSTETFPCELCDQVFHYKAYKARHFDRVHLGIKKKKYRGKRKQTKREKDSGQEILCEKCPKRFSDQKNLQSHIRIVHENVKAYKCEICDRRFGAVISIEID